MISLSFSVSFRQHWRMRTGRPKKLLILQVQDKEKLELIARRPKTSQRAAQRARIVLACARGLNNAQAAREVSVSVATVGKWRARYVALGMESLGDAPRCGAPRQISDGQVEAVVTKTLEEKPRQMTQWSTRLMAAEVGLSHTAIKRIWRTFGLQPHRQESFKLSTDPFFVEKVRDVVGLYLNPPEQTRAVVLCVDEKSQCQALERTPALAAHETGPARAPSRTTTTGTAPPHSLPLWTLPRARSSPNASPGIATRSSSRFLAQIEREVPSEIGHPSGHGQLRHAQSSEGGSLVCAPPALPPAFYSHRALPGSTRSNAGLPKSPRRESGAETFTRSPSWKQPSTTISKRTTPNPSLLSGRQPPI